MHASQTTTPVLRVPRNLPGAAEFVADRHPAYPNASPPNCVLKVDSTVSLLLLLISLTLLFSYIFVLLDDRPLPEHRISKVCKNNKYSRYLNFYIFASDFYINQFIHLWRNILRRNNKVKKSLYTYSMYLITLSG